jgi:hypothetical protein
LEEEEWGEGGMEGLGEGFGGDACVHTPTDPRPRGRKEKNKRRRESVRKEGRPRPTSSERVGRS